MNHHSRTILRCAGLAIQIVGALAPLPSTVQAQVIEPFLQVSKTCPADPVAQGATAICTFTVTNLLTECDPLLCVENLTVQNEFPFGSGIINVGPCLQGGVPVTVLGAAGSATDTCSGSFEEVAPISCTDQEELIIDEIRAEGVFQGLPAIGSTTNAILVAPLICPAAPECNTVTCVSGPAPGPGVGCIEQPAADSTPCGTDTDGLACTTPGCTAAGVCSQTHIEDCGVEICRTPGFWGTHGGTEKSSSTNITQALLDAFNDVNDPDLTICGTEINNTDVGSVNSALEAICVSSKGNQLLQLARQLTAAALNCIITSSAEPNGETCPSAGLTGAVCGGVSIGDIFDACNAACEAGETSVTIDSQVISCVGALDCFNNGGSFEFDEGLGEFVCLEVADSCHDRALDQGCFDFEPPGSAGSSGACNDARKNDVNILP